MKSVNWAVAGATIYLAIYLMLFGINRTGVWIGILFTLSPAVVVLMAIQILKQKAPVADLPEGEEFGYQDRPKDQLGTF
jgi:uncharacterized protein (DUF58 family)